MKLEGIKVLDLSLFLPGPLLTQMMADHGAEVIKLEPLNGGEPNREIGPKRNGVSVYFANTHRGKKSVQINLKTEEGREMALRLAEQADVVIEAFRPGVVDRLGVGYDAISARNPGVVYAQATREFLHLLQLQLVVGPDQQGLVGALDGAVAALEVVAGTDLPHRALDRVVHLGQFGTGDDVE